MYENTTQRYHLNRIQRILGLKKGALPGPFFQRNSFRVADFGTGLVAVVLRRQRQEHIVPTDAAVQCLDNFTGSQVQRVPQVRQV
jgi:hypothetical protein